MPTTLSLPDADPQMDLAPTHEEVLTGSVERVVYHNNTNGFCVLTARPRGHRKPVTIVGTAPALTPGQWLTASGRWVQSPRYGQQFQATHMRLADPTTTDGMEKYLASGLIFGIRKVYAKKLIDAFGSQVFDVIESEPERLRDVPGIGKKRAESIVSAWHQQKAIREIMVFLHTHGLGAARAARIFRTYGVDAVRIMSENPYRLVRDIRSVGFKTADAIAMKLGIDRTATVRLRAGVNYALSEATDDGHCGLPTDRLIPFAAELLDVDETLVRTAADLELQDGNIVATMVADTPCTFLAYLYRAERQIADNLKRLANGPLPWPVGNLDRCLRKAETDSGLALAPQQRDALRLAMTCKTLVLTGGPGVGKTTLVNAFLNAAKTAAAAADIDLHISLCAPTGRAARRLSETTGHEATTIHRLLETDPRNGGFRKNRDNRLFTDAVIVDEASMVDVQLMRSLLEAVPDDASLLILGDTDQLPSVGPGRVLADLIESDRVPVVRLTHIFRQAAESRIITAAHAVNRGEAPDLSNPEPTSDFYFLTAQTPEDTARLVLALVSTNIPRRFGLDPVDDVQVLCPMNRGAAGTHALNAALRERLNPGAEPAIEHFGRTFAPGDKVMQTENDYTNEVFNGDLGRVLSVNPDAGSLEATFDGRDVTYEAKDLDTLTLAYATTVHKSQGSEYPAVVIPWLTQHYPLLQRSLLYTAITRGKRLVVLVGTKKAFHIALRNATARKRWTRLSEWIRELA